MSTEKNSVSESNVFVFVLWVLFLFRNVISAYVGSCFVVRFCMVCGALQCWFECGSGDVEWLRLGKTVWKKKGACP